MNRTVRMLAKEVASAFYDQERSPAFRATFPTLKHYLTGVWVLKDGTTQIKTPGWHHHVGQARQMLVRMLGQSDERIKPHLKEAIFDDIIDDRNRQEAAKANKTLRNISQVNSDGKVGL